MIEWEKIEDKLTALGESEMQMFRFLLGKPAGVILTVETDKMLAKLLAEADLVYMDGDIVVIPPDVREAYESGWDDAAELKWKKRNWMYKCIEAGKYLYGVMTWDVLGRLFRLAYPDTDAAEACALFDSTPANSQWFTERDGKLVLNGFEQNDYYKYLEETIQGDIDFYIPTCEEVEELYEQGCLVSRESHAKLRDFIADTFGVEKDVAAFKVHELYESVNNHARMNDAAEAFAADESGRFSFPSDEVEVKFIERYMEMSRECRIRDNRGHDYYEMVALMSLKNSGASGRSFGAGLADGAKGGIAGSSTKAAGAQVKRVKIGRNDPCPSGSGKKYKNCCGKN